MSCPSRECGRLIEYGEWRYCPECGRRTCMLVCEDGDRPQQKFLSGMDELKPKIRLRNTDQSAAKVIKCKATCNGRELTVTPSAAPDIKPGALQSFEALLDLPKSVQNAEVIFEITSDDGDRGVWPNNWDDSCVRSWSVTVDVRIVEAGDIEVYPEAVFLSPEPNDKTADFQLVNRGGAAAVVNRITGPLDAVDSSGQRLSYPLRVEPGETRITLKAPDGSDVTQLNGESVELHIQGGSSKKLPILVPKAEGVKVVPAYVVAIDFGTVNTSIAVWEVGKPWDETVLIENEEGLPRFPSEMFVPFSGSGLSYEFGGTAARRWSAEILEEKPRGFLVKQLKTELRSSGDRFAKDYGPGYSKDKLARRYFSYLKGLIDSHFVSATGYSPGSQVEVLYYVSVPVLDRRGFGDDRDCPDYQQQLHSTQCAVEGDPNDPSDQGAGFPKGQVRYVLEPASAALYCFNRLRDRGRLVLEGDDKLCVFDSGGGTTDICVMDVDIADGEPRFAVLGVCGEAAGGLQFGGERVTKELGQFIEAKYESDTRYKGGKDARSFSYGGAAYVDMLKQKLTEVLSEGRDRIDFSEAVMGFQGLELTEEEEAHVVEPGIRPILTALGTLLDGIGIDPIRLGYSFAVGGNSLVPYIRKQLYTFFRGDLSDKVLPHLTDDAGAGDDSPIYIGSGEESRVLMEAVARGSAMWYSCRIVKQLPFGVKLRVSGHVETLASKEAAFMKTLVALRATPNRPTDCSLFLDNVEESVGISEGCRIGYFQLPASAQQHWRLEVLLDRDYRLCVFASDPAGTRREVFHTRLSAAMDALSIAKE